jgi:outer membrane protein OmpA-like peptidoglycan-associated protein
MCVFEEGSSRRIEKAKVTITEVKETGNGNELSDGNLMLALKPIEENSQEYVLSVIGNRKNEKDVITDFYTNEEGELTHRIKPGKQYRIKSVKKGYEDAEAIVSYEDLRSESGYCVPMKRKSCMVLNGIVLNKEFSKAMPGAEVRIENKCTGETQKYTVGNDGKFDLCIECGCEYRFLGMKSGFDSDTEFLFPKPEDCNAEKELEVKLELGVRKIVKTEPAPPVTVAPPAPPTVQYVPKVTYVPRTVYEPVTTYVPSSDLPVGRVNGHYLGDPNATYREGMVIHLKDIYYNFDKYDIRIDASKDLQRLLELLRTYPSMHISLESHTDSRGSSAYNKQLSSNRAKAARSYLISQGIDEARLTSEGFGETRLKNRCSDGVTCSEAEHQQNRRTEVRVTRFDRTDVRVEYQK